MRAGAMTSWRQLDSTHNTAGASNDFWRQLVARITLRVRTKTSWRQLVAHTARASNDFLASTGNAHNTGRASIDFLASTGSAHNTACEQWLPGVNLVARITLRAPANISWRQLVARITLRARAMTSWRRLGSALCQPMSLLGAGSAPDTCADGAGVRHILVRDYLGSAW
jgi:hypothetical protein